MTRPISGMKACRNRLVIRGVNSSGLGMDQFWKGIDIGRLQLGQVAIAENLERKVMLKGEFGQHVHIGGISGLRPLRRRKSQFLEEDFSKLLGGINIENFSGQSVDPVDL